MLHPLTPREAEVLAALSAGNTQKEVAAQLGISASRVHDIAARIRLKAGASTMVQAATRLKYHGNRSL